MGVGPHSVMCIWASSLGFRLLSCKRGMIGNIFLRPVVRREIAKPDEMLITVTALIMWGFRASRWSFSLPAWEIMGGGGSGEDSPCM